MKKSRLTVKGAVLDRGQLKWGSLMLPEHVRMLREWEVAYASDQKPELDEAELSLLQEEIEIAYRRQCTVELRYWTTQLSAITGVITAIDLSAKSVEVENGERLLRIPFNELCGIRLLE